MNDEPEERDVKNFMILHIGFEKPTPEEMAAWGKGFESIAGILRLLSRALKTSVLKRD